MSRFSEALKSVIRDNSLSLADVEHLTGVDHSNISRLVNGERGPTRPVLNAICRRLHPSPSVQYDLLVAHLLDETEAAGLNVSDLRIRYAPGSVSIFESLSLSLQADLELLASEAEKMPVFRRLIEDWARVVALNRAALADLPPLQLVAEEPSEAYPGDHVEKIIESRKLPPTRQPKKK